MKLFVIRDKDTGKFSSGAQNGLHSLKWRDHPHFWDSRSAVTCHITNNRDRFYEGVNSEVHTFDFDFNSQSITETVAVADWKKLKAV